MSSGQVTLSLTGNCFFQDRPSAYTDPRFLQLVQLLRGSDCAMTNLEFVIHNGEPFPAYVAGGRAASYLAAPPHVVAELKWMGINLVYAANNHVHDFAEDGITTTIKYLNAGGLAYAGIGPSLTTSTMPGYYQTDKGRVALVSASDWGPRGKADLPFQMPTGVMPGDADAFFKARPGINLLRYDAVNTVDKEAFGALKRMSKALGWEEAKAGRRAGGGRAEPFVSQSILGCEQDNAKQFHFMGRKFVLGKSFDFSTEPYEADLQRNFKWVREARRTADFVVAALHDQGARREQDEVHVRAFARGAIDAGADVAVACTAGGSAAWRSTRARSSSTGARPSTFRMKASGITRRSSRCATDSTPPAPPRSSSKSGPRGRPSAARWWACGAMSSGAAACCSRWCSTITTSPRKYASTRWSTSPPALARNAGAPSSPSRAAPRQRQCWSAPPPAPSPTAPKSVSRTASASYRSSNAAPRIRRSNHDHPSPYYCARKCSARP